MPKAVKVLLVVIVLLAGVLIGADRVLAVVAERKLADQVSAELQKKGLTTSQEPQVSIGGFPFLTQMLAGKYSSIQITAPDVTSGNVKFTSLDVRVEGVVADDFGLTPVLAEKVTGEGIVPFGSIVALLPRSDVTVIAVGEKLQLRLPLNFGEQSLVVVATVMPSISDGRLRLAVDEVGTQDGGALPAFAQMLLMPVNALLSAGFELPKLPYDMRVDRVEVADTGLRAWASAADVPLN
ncbi:MAG: DUF2993 domain-containing protein [Longispora sp.]|nr:DUF2993 domain-containing protein [Longispora sp. (in: high G+C Gram-positive bacteria)]